MDCVSEEWKNGEGDYVAYIRIEERERKPMLRVFSFFRF